MKPATRMKRGLVLAAMFVALSAGADALSPPPGRSVDELLAYARQNNPELRMSAMEAQAAQSRVASASALPDPRFQIEMMDVNNAGSGGSTSLLPGEVGATRYALIQPLPFWGKRGLRGEVAAAQAAQSETARDALALDIEMNIKSAYARYWQAVGQLRILDETLVLLDAVERQALSRYGVGLVPQQDVLRAQSELTSLKLDRVDAERRRRDAVARINALLPRPADAPLAEPAALPTMPPALALPTLWAEVQDRSPELARERHAVIAAEKGRALSYRNRYPDFSVGLRDNRPKSGIETWDVMLEVNIPLQQGSRRAQEGESEHRLESARARVAAVESRLQGRLGQAHAAYEASGDKVRLLRDTLLPQSRATLAAAQAGYETGRVNFNTLLDAERQILRVRLSLLDAEAEQATRLAEIEQLVGGSP